MVVATSGRGESLLCSLGRKVSREKIFCSSGGKTDNPRVWGGQGRSSFRSRVYQLRAPHPFVQSPTESY